jgi:O-antigen biosynthesis protein WbqP
MKRPFDILLCIVASMILFIPAVFVALAVFITSPGPILYWSDRVGRNNKIFKMPKFRTMHIGTPEVATHLLIEPTSHLTPIGTFLRKNSIDELPQLWCIFSGKMSFVGPRPALFNQQNLITLRTEAGINKLLPGLTGWAQINGRDKLTDSEKVIFDKFYLEKQCFVFDVKIIILTFIKAFNGKNFLY